MSKNKLTIGDYPNNIAKQMKLRNKDKDNIAYKANLSRSMFTSLIEGKRQLKMTWARNLALAIGCSVDDLYVPTKKELVISLDDTPKPSTIEPAITPATSFTPFDIEILLELTQREFQFCSSTGREIMAKACQEISGKLRAYDQKAINPVPQPKTEQKPKTEPVNTKTKKKTNVFVMPKLSRPWSMEDLADALSALRCGMDAEVVAELTNRPVREITGTKMLFSWLWTKSYPSKPSQRDILDILQRVQLKPSTRRAIFERSGV